MNDVFQVTEKKCATVPRTIDNDDITTDKCTAGLGQEVCQQTTLKLPRQVPCTSQYTDTLFYFY